MVKNEESVLVVVRCRPLNSKEIEQELEEAGERSGQTKDKHESHTSTPSSTGANAFVGGCVNMMTKTGLVEIRHPKSAPTDPPKSFTFDYVYDWNSKQSELYEETFAPLVNSVLMGFNGTIFAYGQTGTGKTFTMEGIKDDNENMGVIPRTFIHIFDDHIRSAPREEKYLVTASYLEIYQEEIRDLLSKEHLTKRLDLRERPDTGVYVKDLTSFVCKSRSEIERVMSVGNANRSVSSTNMNEHSSRSHAIFIITIECSCPTEQNESHIRVGKLNLVDLAGSERQAKTGATGERLKEATKINLSLSALGNVISALVDAKTSHIPYRDSKLTRLLQDSLGGNAKTVMVANIGPASFNYDESLTTLRYANRAKNIKNKPRINEDPKDALLREFQEEIARLKAQLSNRMSSSDKKKSRKKSSPKSETVGEDGETEREDRASSSMDRSSGTDNSTVSSPEPSVEPEQMETRLTIERDLLENDTTLLAAERRKLLEDLAIKEERLKKEKEDQEGMMSKIKALESKLISGTGSVNMVERTNEQQRMLEKRRADLAEIRRVEKETAQQLEAQEEIGEELGRTYTSLQQEVETKTRKLRKLFTKLQAVKQDINDVTEEFNRDRRDLEETQQQLLKELKLKVLIIENFIPPNEKVKLISRCIYDDEEDSWKLSQNFESMLAKSAITKRPVSAVGSRRPISDYARMMSASSNSSASSDNGQGSLIGLGGIRYRGENIMRLSLDRGGRTTRDYEGPTVAPRVQAALDAAMHNVEPDIEVDVSALNAKVGQAPVRGFRKHTSGQTNSKKNAKNCWKDKSTSEPPSGEAYPSSRGLVPK